MFKSSVWPSVFVKLQVSAFNTGLSVCMFDSVCVRASAAKRFNTIANELSRSNNTTTSLFVMFNCGRAYVCVCVCVSSVHCTSQEWETSEYSDSLLCKP